MDERARFVFEAQLSGVPFTQLCRDYGISRKTGYKWTRRYQSQGLAGLSEHSRAPHTHPNRVDATIEELLVAERKRHPTWGPVKLLEIMRTHHNLRELPARSTAALILKRHGLTKPPKRIRGARPKYFGALQQANGPNDVWTADFKGWFRTGDGVPCHPLTICDLHSRSILCCRCQRSNTTRETEKNFLHTFREYGLPKVIRVDNGIPFSSRALGGLSRLSIGWLRLGISVDFIAPGRPDQNGAHERMHRTLKAETTIPPAATHVAQQRRFDHWREEFNTVRPHEALGLRTPWSRYERSERELPAARPSFSYPGWYETRYVHTSGIIKWRGTMQYLGEVFAGETVGLRPHPGEMHVVYAGPIVLGALASDGSGGLRRPPDPPRPPAAETH